MLVDSKEHGDGVLIVTLDRPEKRNALNLELLKELQTALIQAIERSSDRVILLTGRGTAFSAGADLSDYRGLESSDEAMRRFAGYASELAAHIEAISDLLEYPSVTTVAGMNGSAVGGGYILALSCDFRVMADEAEVWFPEARFGRAIGAPSMWRLVSRFGYAAAVEIAMLSKRLSAAELHALDAAHRVVPAALFPDAALSLAEELSRVPRKTRQLIKERALSFASQRGNVHELKGLMGEDR